MGDRRSTTRRKQRVDPGPRSRAGLNRERVVASALELIDEEGLDALSMRRLAERLAVKPMSLYSHVANKEELLDGVVTKVLSEVELPGPNVFWRNAVREAFTSYRRVLLRHPHVAPMILHRPARDAEAFLAVLDYSLDIFRRAGLHPKAALNAHRIITAFATGLVMNELTAPDPRGNVLLLWTQLLGAGRFPNVEAALPDMLNRDIDETFELGLDILIDGIHRNTT